MKKVEAPTVAPATFSTKKNDVQWDAILEAISEGAQLCAPGSDYPAEKTHTWFTSWLKYKGARKGLKVTTWRVDRHGTKLPDGHVIAVATPFTPEEKAAFEASEAAAKAKFKAKRAEEAAARKAISDTKANGQGNLSQPTTPPGAPVTSSGTVVEPPPEPKADKPHKAGRR